MRIAIASDHAAVELKAQLVRWLTAEGREVTDLGPDGDVQVDYPDYGYKLAEHIAGGQSERGIALCGSGVGISIAVNRHPGCRCALVNEPIAASITTPTLLRWALVSSGSTRPRLAWPRFWRPPSPAAITIAGSRSSAIRPSSSLFRGGADLGVGELALEAAQGLAVQSRDQGDLAIGTIIAAQHAAVAVDPGQGLTLVSAQLHLDRR